MVLKTTKLVLVLSLVLVPASRLQSEIVFTPASPNVEQAVTFSVTPPSGFIQQNTIAWDFGDNQTATGVATVSHVYLQAGTMRVRANYWYLPTAFGDSINRTDYISVNVVERRRVDPAQSTTLTDREVVFNAVNFFSSSVSWDFGDGSGAIVAGRTVSHVYRQPGKFTVTARDNGGAGKVALRAEVTVNPDYNRRSISFSPEQPMAGREVVFTAKDFFSSELRWDFGDGSPPRHGSTLERHLYSETGVYTVRAWDWRGQTGPAVLVQLKVERSSGPAAPFHISFLQLRFADGLAYRVVPRDSENLKAYVDLKYEGTGFFQAQWLVDGMPFRPVSRALTFADSITLDTGDPGLPTWMPGLHEVSLRILRPQGDLTVPVIRYFVSASTEAPGLAAVSMSLADVKGLRGVAGTYEIDLISLPDDQQVILNGVLTWSEDRTLSSALLRFHLDDRLLDQQLLRELKPGEKRTFTTSLPKTGPETASLYITLYDISRADSPVLLFLQRIKVAAAD